MSTPTNSIATTGNSEAVTAFLAFLERDMKIHPERIGGLSRRWISSATRLTKGGKITDDERPPEDF